MKSQKSKVKSQKVKNNYWWCLQALCALATSLSITSTTDARVTRIVIDKIESPTFGGQEFSAVGKYEKLIGRVFGEVDPNAPENVEIINLDKAPKAASGHVTY